MLRRGTRFAPLLAIAVSLVAASFVAPSHGLVDRESRQAASKRLTVDRHFFFAGLDWVVLTGRAGTNSRAQFRAPNVSFDAAHNLVITTARHCSARRNVPDQLATHPRRCRNLSNTRYSSGRAELLTLPSGGNFSVSFTARMPQRSAAGSRMALWLVHRPYCDANNPVNTTFGELDALEWYSRGRGTSRSTTHMTCDRQRTPQFLSKAVKATINAAKAHTWKVVRDGRVVKYFVDGTRVAKHACGATKPFGSLGPLQCDAILNGPWYIVMQGEVFKKGGGTLLSGPSSRATFPTQRMVISNVTLNGLTQDSYH